MMTHVDLKINNERGRHQAPVYDSMMSEIPKAMNPTTVTKAIFWILVVCFLEQKRIVTAMIHQKTASSRLKVPISIYYYSVPL
ncbi:MAG: hypothetical protein ACMUJM_21190 [bacterium]